MTNEEKILSLLEKHGEILEKHSEMLDRLDRRMDELDERQTKTEIILENTIVPRLDALAEGQKSLMEALAPKSRVEALEEEVDLLKTAVRSLSRDMAELKKAQ